MDWTLNVHHEIPCLLQALGIQYFGWTTVLWWFLVSFNLYYVVVLRHSLEDYVILFHFIGWGIPTIFTIIPAWAQVYGRAGTWCWINNPTWALSFYYGEMGLLLVLGTILWLFIIRISLQTSRINDPSASIKRYTRHVLFVATFFLVFTLMFVHRLYEYEHPNQPQSFALLLMHAIAISSQGMIVFFVFGLTSDNIQSWKLALSNYWSAKSGSYDPLPEEP